MEYKVDFIESQSELPARYVEDDQVFDVDLSPECSAVDVDVGESAFEAGISQDVEIFSCCLDAAYSPVIHTDTQPYTGPYAVTPTTEEQIIPVKGKHMMHDMVVNPIPSNYGLVTWNGAILTVS